MKSSVRIPETLLVLAARSFTKSLYCKNDINADKVRKLCKIKKKVPTDIGDILYKNWCWQECYECSTPLTQKEIKRFRRHFFHCISLCESCYENNTR